MNTWRGSLLAPALIFISGLFIVPFIYTLWLSFTDLNFVSPGREGNWIGLANYSYALFGDPIFLDSLKRSAQFAALCVAPQVIFGLAVGEALFHRPWAQRLLTPLFALPALIPAVAVGLYWRLLLQGEFGALSYYLTELGFGSATGLLGDARTILITIAVVDFWQWAPFTTLVFLAARTALPTAPIEAAYLDGASPTRAFFDVILPGLAPAILFISTLRAIDSFKEFDKVYVITGGGPGTATELASLYVWRTSFVYWEVGYGAALCVIIYIAIYFTTAITVGRWGAATGKS